MARTTKGNAMSAFKHQPGFFEALEEKRIDDEVRWAAEYERYLADQEIDELRQRLEIEKGVSDFWRYQAQNSS
jgi:hypothetical protein